MRVLQTLLFTLLLAGDALAYPHIPVPPVDESYKDPALQDLHNALLAAVLARDVEAVVHLAAPDIHLGFDGATGHDELLARLNAPDADYWSELETALRMGGHYDIHDGQAEFWAPFTWGAPDTESAGVAPFAAYVVIGKDVQIRSAPSRSATAIGLMSYEVVKSCGDECGPAYGENKNWLAVEMPDGRKGWIAKRYVRHLLDLRLGFGRIDGRWQWTRALAGD